MYFEGFLNSLLQIFDSAKNGIMNHPSQVIALCALGLTFYQGYQTRRHNRLSVRPQLHTSTGKESFRGNNITVCEAYLANKGLGPAVINRFEVVKDDVPIEILEPNDISKIFTDIFGQGCLVNDECSYMVFREKSILAKDDKELIAKVVFKMGDNLSDEQLDEKLSSIHLRVGYESIYGEQSVYDSRQHNRISKHKREE